MKKTSWLFIALLLLLYPATGLASSTYFSAQIGYAFIDDLYDVHVGNERLNVTADDNWSAAIAVGRDYGFIRFETELAYQKNDMDKITYKTAEDTFKLSTSGDVSSVSVLFNLYHDFKNNSPFTPFVTGGIGISRISSSSIRPPSEIANNDSLKIPSDNDTVFAYQVGAGVAYEAHESIFFDFKYRYFGTHDPKISGVEMDYKNHILYLGLRLPFI